MSNNTRDTTNVRMARWLAALIIEAAMTATMFDLNPMTRHRMNLLHQAADATVVATVVDATAKTMQVPLVVAGRNPNGSWTVYPVDTYTGRPMEWVRYTVTEDRLADYMMQAARDTLRRTPMQHPFLDLD